MSLFCCPIGGGPWTGGLPLFLPGGAQPRPGPGGLCPPAASPRMHSKMPGDDKRAWPPPGRPLSWDYYAPCGTPGSIALANTGPAPSVLDTGCGRGVLHQRGLSGPAPGEGLATLAGDGHLKAILRRAAKREKDAEFAVASSYHLPVADGSVDLLLNCFSPLAIEEFHRVLRPGGVFVYVVPSEKHLWELKQVLYDRPYPNEVKQTPYPGFSYQEIRHVEAVIHLPCQEDIHALFQMTPYYWAGAGAWRR